MYPLRLLEFSGVYFLSFWIPKLGIWRKLKKTECTDRILTFLNGQFIDDVYEHNEQDQRDRKVKVVWGINKTTTTIVQVTCPQHSQGTVKNTHDYSSVTHKKGNCHICLEETFFKILLNIKLVINTMSGIYRVTWTAERRKQCAQSKTKICAF